MADTLDALADHLRRRGQPARIVVWEHNSHLGDARATDMGAGGERNVRQPARERHGTELAHGSYQSASPGYGETPGRGVTNGSLFGSVRSENATSHAIALHDS